MYVLPLISDPMISLKKKLPKAMSFGNGLSESTPLNKVAVADDARAYMVC